MRHNRLCAIAVLILLSLSGCATSMQTSPKGIALDLNSSKSIKDKKNKRIEEIKKIKKDLTEPQPSIARKSVDIERVPIFDKEKSLTVAVSSDGKHYKDKEEKIKISVEEIPVNEFINLVYGDILKVNYIVDDMAKNTKSTVTLHMQSPQNIESFSEVAKEILSLKGIGIKEQDGVLLFYRARKQSGKEFNEDVLITYGRNLPENLNKNKFVWLFVPYYYISPSDAIGVLQQIGLGTDKIKIFSYVKNLQTLYGKYEYVQKALDVIKLIDRPYLSGKKPYLIYLNHVNVNKYFEKIKSIFKVHGINVHSTPSAVSGIVMVPITELNALYVITPKKEWIDMLMYWKEKLDVPSNYKEEDARIYIYRVKNRKANEIVGLVSKILGSVTAINSLELNTKKVPSVKKTRKAIISKTDLKAGKVKHSPHIIADKDTNVLIMKLTPADFKRVLPFLRELDRLPLQTLVEVTVAEVTMTDTFSLGFEYAIKNISDNLKKNSLEITGGGGGIGVVFKGDYLTATINAYAEKKLLNIISKPKILILNNSTGTINVGTQVPVITSEVSTGDVATQNIPAISRNITYRNTGINLGITPTINSNNVLTVSINISLSEAQTNDTSGIDSPLIVNRDLSTIAVVNSGDTILIGGLISKNKSKSKGGVPFLKDIPIIGTLFKNQGVKVTKTELIMLIRPIIVKNREVIKDQTTIFSSALKNLEIANF